MSYILDALRKAETERELGAVPHLHAHGAAAALTIATDARARLWPWAVAGVMIAVIVVLGWWRLEPGPVAVVTMSAPRTSPVAVPALVVAAPAPEPSVRAATAPSPVPSPSPKRETPPLTVEELPSEIRRTLPVLAVNGAIYSEQASARMLIVNGQLMHEGEAVAPGLMLLSIGPKSALLRYRETRFTVRY